MDKTVSSKDLIKFGMRGYKDTVDVNWHGKIIEIKTLLSQEEEIRLIHDIVDFCTKEDGSSIMPELLDFSTRLNIICAYANINLPNNTDDIYKLVCYSDLYKYVIDNVNDVQVNNIIKSATYIGLNGK